MPTKGRDRKFNCKSIDRFDQLSVPSVFPLHQFGIYKHVVSVTRLTLFFLAAVASVALSGSYVFSMTQDPPETKPGGMMPPENLPRVVGPGVLPDLMYMRNDKGEEILVPRTRYEDFERLLMETELGGEGLAATPSLNQLDLTIEPVSTYANVQVRGLISLKKASRSTWTVPIALSQLQWIPLKKPVAEKTIGDDSNKQIDSSDGLESIATSAQSNGYLWRVGPGKSLLRRLECDAVCKLMATTTGYNLRLDLPPAATVIKLRLPKGDWELNANGGGNEVIEPLQVQGEYSVAIIRTSSNSINLSWSRKVNREVVAAIEVRSQTKFSTSGDSNRWRADTALSIRGPIKLGGKRILWTLPAQGLLREANSNVINFSGYRLVREVPGSGTVTDPVALAEELPTDAWWIEIDENFNRSEIDVNLEWELSRASNDSQMIFESPKFDGIDRHFGTIDFAIPRTVSIQWKTFGVVQLLRQAQAADGSDSIVYSFQFTGQPSRIQTQWTTVVDSPRIASEQRVEVRGNRLLLRGSIEFGSDPIQLPLLQLELQGWKPERVILFPSEVELPLDSIVTTTATTDSTAEPSWSLPIAANLWIRGNPGTRPSSAEGVRSDRIPESSGSVIGTPGAYDVMTPGSDKRDSNQSWRIEYLLSRSTDNGTSEVNFSLPKLSWLSQDTQSRTDRNLPGRLVIYSWPYRLSTNANSTAGLMESVLDRNFVRQILGGNTGASPFLLQYQIGDSNDWCRWSGLKSRKGSFVSAAMVVNAEPSSAAIDWRTRWECKCYGSRPSELEIGIPIDTTGLGNGRSDRDLEIRIDNQAIPFTLRNIETTESDKYQWVKFAVPEVSTDGSNRLDFLLEFNFSTALKPLSIPDGQANLELSMPKLRSTQSLQPALSEQVLVEEARLLLKNNTSFDVTYPKDSSRGAFDLDPLDPRIEISLRRAQSDKSPTIRLDGEWLQTIVNAIEQRDRYVAKFQTDESLIRIPVSADAIRNTEWIVDGQRANLRETRVDGDPSVYAIISLPDSNPQASPGVHVLEAFTTRAAPKGWLRKVEPIGPRLQAGPSSAPMIWQLIVPRTEHLMSTPQNALPMYQWRWSDLILRRVGQTNQEQIEERFGATKQPILAQQVNQYELTSFSSTRPLQATFVPSALIWLPVSLLVLSLAIILKDNRWIRWPWFWAIFLSMFFIFSQLAWDISVLVLQAAVAAVGLALIYQVTKWLLDRRARRRSIFISRQFSPSAGSRANVATNIYRKLSAENSANRPAVKTKPKDPQ